MLRGAARENEETIWTVGFSRAVIWDLTDYVSESRARRRLQQWTGTPMRDQREVLGDGPGPEEELNTAEAYPLINCPRCCRRARGIFEIGGPQHTRVRGCLLRGFLLCGCLLAVRVLAVLCQLRHWFSRQPRP